MRFFGRRNRHHHNDRTYEQYYHDHDHGHGRDPTYRYEKRLDAETLGSALPTVDQFEIAVPSKSFHSTGSYDYNPSPYAPETREDDDNKSSSDVSSITSVSYRAGYYFLRNTKNKKPLKRSKSLSFLPTCAQPCNCSWLSCCCCSQAKSEIATSNINSRRGGYPMHPNGTTQRGRKFQQSASDGGLGGAVCQGAAPLQTSRRHSYVASQNRSRGRNNRRYTTSDIEHREAPTPFQYYEYSSPHTPRGRRAAAAATAPMKRNHSLFDELTEDETATYNQLNNKNKYNHYRKHSGGGGDRSIIARAIRGRSRSQSRQRNHRSNSRPHYHQHGNRHHYHYQEPLSPGCY